MAETLGGRSRPSHRREATSTHEIEDYQRYALISVSDKTGVVDLARVLDRLGIKIISTGGTTNTLREDGLSVIPIEEITGNPESFDGRMKTISFPIEGGILFDRSNPSHVEQAKTLGIKPIDIVVTNLYPFERTVADPDVPLEDVIESIDVGGPTMVRAAAKNFKNVLVVVSPESYDRVAEALTNGTVDENLRRELAAKAFGHLAFYDSLVARFLNKEDFPEELTIPGRKSFDLRYGENPHQKAAVYFESNTNSPLARLQRLTGRELSYVNFTDIAAGLESVRIFNEPAAVVIKHNTPSGIALGEFAGEALRRAVIADPESAFGGVIVLNTPLDLAAAKIFVDFKKENGVLIDIVAAPGIDSDAMDFIRGIRKSTGIYTFGDIPDQRSNNKHKRFFDGGYVVQGWDDDIERSFDSWTVVSKAQPTEREFRQMRLAWKFISRIKSNTVIVVDRDLPMTRGIGSGQTSRVRSTKIALEQAGENVQGAILASDSFFPFDDSVKLAAQYEIAAIVEQGGSINDKASIDAANAVRIPLVFTGERKFWH